MRTNLKQPGNVGLETWPERLPKRRAAATANPRDPASRAAGYLMIECLVYLALLTVITGFGFSAFYHCMANSRDLTRNAEDIVKVLHAGERWRADVRAAIDSPRIQEENGATAFEIPHADGRVVYLFDKYSIWRKQGMNEPREILAGVGMSRMIEDVRKNVTVWRWDLELQRRKKAIRLKPIFTFQAVQPALSPSPAL